MAELKVNFEELNKRRIKAAEYKDNWLSRYVDFYRYVSPDRDALNVRFNYQDKGKLAESHIYDSTAQRAAKQRANDLHGLLLPQDRRWGELSVNPMTVSRASISEYQLKTILTQLNETVFYYLNQSNLAGIVAASNLDLNCGTAAIYIDSPSDENPFNFYSIPAATLYLEYTHEYTIDNAWFDKRMTGIQIRESFPQYNGDMLDKYRDKPYDEYSVHYGQVRMQDPRTKRWGYLSYAVPKGDETTPLFSEWYPFKRLIVYRDYVRPGEVEGRGVAIELMPTILDLNKMVKNHRKSIQFKANPAILYDTTSKLNPTQIKEWAGIMLPRTPGSRPFEVMEMPEMPEVFQTIKSLQNDILNGFKVDPLGDVGENPSMSATEVSIRENRAQRTSATDISRLINELPRAVFENALKILAHRGMLNKDAEQVIYSSLTQFNYSSPLYDLQKQSDMNHLVQKLQFIQQFFGEGATIATSNVGEISDFANNALNLKPTLFRSGTQIDQLMSNVAQRAANSPQMTPQPTTAAQQLPANNLSLQGVAV